MKKDPAPSGTTSGVRLAALSGATSRFRLRLVRVGSVGLCAVCVAIIVIGVATGIASTIASGVAGLLTYVVAYALTLRGDGRHGQRVFIYGLLINALGAALGTPATPVGVASYGVLASLMVLLGAVMLEKIELLLCVAVGTATIFIAYWKLAAIFGFNSGILVTVILTVAIVWIEALALSLFMTRVNEDQRDLRTYVEEVDRVLVHAARITEGDLTAPVDGDSDVSATIRAMQAGLRGMVTRTRDAISAMATSAQEIEAMARQQEQGALEQASAVSQVHGTLARLSEGAGRAVESTAEVLRNVELTSKTSETVAQRAATLSSHTRRIASLLEVIKAIANKSEILALNAALEGARAGEAGRGFSLVASQMQRLAESVMGSVGDVRTLVEDIDTATAATLAATEESTRLSAKATEATRRITVTLQDQQVSARQVAMAMGDIQQVAAQVSSGTGSSLAAMRDLTRLASELTRAIEGFRLG